MFKQLLLSLLSLCLFYYTADAQRIKKITYNDTTKAPRSLEIHEGILSQQAMRIKYKRNGKKVAMIVLSKPVKVAMAEQEEQWGYFQFPGIGKATDGSLRITWQMNADSHKSYGTTSGRENLPMWSYDGGKTWRAEKKLLPVRSRHYSVSMSNGGYLQIYTPSSKDIESYDKFPSPVGTKGARTYYRETSLPDDLRGVYFTYSDSEGKAEIIHSTLNDPGLLRYASDGLMPIVWWGSIKQLSNNSLVAGVYPTYYLDSNGKVLPGSVSFYKSIDKGQTWDILGKIPFVNDGIANKRGDGCFEEPAFDILADGSFICILRSGSTSPMYKTFSTDGGKTWTTPVPFSPNGVRPMLMRLNNGVLVLASGRPGVQLRFSLDGTGREWTNPIDMVPFMNEDGSYTRDVSCGYVSMIEIDKDSFYMVYSDFNTKNRDGETRKSIMGRKVIVQRL